MNKKKIKHTHKVKLSKIVAPKPGKRHVELVIEGPEEVLPAAVIPPEPIPVEESGLWHWFQSIWE